MAGNGKPEGTHLNPRYSFVIQFRETDDHACKQDDGMIEHVVSGKRSHFHSRAELFEVIDKTLADLEASSKS